MWELYRCIILSGVLIPLSFTPYDILDI